jgi:acetylornithine deacetylase/succinyl-diaminopimelate desuccinylase-like protein
VEYGDVQNPRLPTIGTTDTHYLVYEGIPCCGFLSPAPRGGNGHAANEHMPIDGLVEITRSAALAFLRYWSFARA